MVADPFTTSFAFLGETYLKIDYCMVVLYSSGEKGNFDGISVLHFFSGVSGESGAAVGERRGVLQSRRSLGRISEDQVHG